MNRKVWSAEEKLSVVLEMLKGEPSVTEICLRHQVAVSQAYHWRDMFLENGKKAFIDRRHKNNNNHLLDENRRLKELVGSLVNFGDGSLFRHIYQHYNFSHSFLSILP